MTIDDDNDGQMIFGELLDICLAGEKKNRKNLTQETCPDRGLNPGPLRDRRACYPLSHSGGQQKRLLYYRPQGRTDLGRPHLRWTDQFLS